MTKTKEELEYESEFDVEGISDEEMSKAEALTSKLDAFRITLESELSSAKAAKKMTIEPKLTQAGLLYNGIRDDSGRASLEEGITTPKQGSRVYKNITRQITNDGYKQLGDLLFPTDDRNYALREVAVAEPPQALLNEPAVSSTGEPLIDAEGQPLTNGQAHQRRVQKVRRKVKRMMKKVDATLTEARYASKGREVIKHAAIYGTGILKAPIPKTKTGEYWAKRKGGKWDLKTDDTRTADLKVVSPLDFFPDLSVGRVEDCGYSWERSYTSPEDLEDEGEDYGYDPKAVAFLMTSGPKGSPSDDTARNTLRADNPQSLVTANRLEIYQRHGKVKRAFLEAYGVKLTGSKSYYPAIVWLCQGRILKVALQPFRKTESLYSVFCWEENEENIFGEGVPHLMEHCQKTFNTAWNITLDNAGVSAMPQVVVDKLGIEPADGSSDYSIRGGKVWNRTGTTYSNEGSAKPFELFPITQDIQQLFLLMDKAERTAYTLTGVTYVDRQNQSPDNAPVTLGATNIFQNNSTVSRRGLARQWDDKITLTVITRMYDFFMQYEADDEIKHAMQVEPRGSTVLLAKELAANNLLQLYQLTQGGTADGVKGMELLRGISVAMQFAEDKYIETDDELAARAEATANQPDPALELQERELAIKEAKVELEQAELNFRVQEYQSDTMFKQELEQAKLELRMFELEHKDKELDITSQVKMAQLQASLQATEKLSSLDNQNRRDIAAAQLQVKATADSHNRSINANETSLRARETALHEKELNHKITTGQSGI